LVLVLPTRGGVVHAVDLVQPGHPGLDPHRLETLLDVAADRVVEPVDRGAGGVGVGEQPGAGGAAEQLVQRLARLLRGDVPQGHVDRGDRAHRHRAAAPVRAAVEVLPDRLDLRLVPADQGGGDMIAEVGGDGELAAVQGAVAQYDETIAGGDRDGDEVATGAGDVHVDAIDGHAVPPVRAADRTPPQMFYIVERIFCGS